MTTKTYYGILFPDDTLARIADVCGDYSLTANTNHPEWLVTDPQIIANTLFTDVRYYNSTGEQPCWGGFKREHLRPAKIVMEVSVAHDIKIPVNIDCLETRDLPWVLAKQYAGFALPRDGVRYVFVLTALSQEEAQKHLGEIVHFGGNLHSPRKVVAVSPVPEDYIDPDKGMGVSGKKPQSLLICEVSDT